MRPVPTRHCEKQKEEDDAGAKGEQKGVLGSRGGAQGQVRDEQTIFSVGREQRG